MKFPHIDYNNKKYVDSFSENLIFLLENSQKLMNLEILKEII